MYLCPLLAYVTSAFGPGKLYGEKMPWRMVHVYDFPPFLQTKGNNFCDFLFCFLGRCSSSEMLDRSTLKVKMLPKDSGTGTTNPLLY